MTCWSWCLVGARQLCWPWIANGADVTAERDSRPGYRGRPCRLRPRGVFRLDVARHALSSLEATTRTQCIDGVLQSARRLRGDIQKVPTRLPLADLSIAQERIESASAEGGITSGGLLRQRHQKSRLKSCSEPHAWCASQFFIGVGIAVAVEFGGIVAGRSRARARRDRFTVLCHTGSHEHC